ncbi:MAG: hypothetical protein AB7E74_24750 [Pirellulales bacterium]
MAFAGVGIRIGKINPANGTDKVWHFRAFGGRVTRTTDWTAGNIGIQFVNTNMSGWMNFTIRGFNIGIELLGDGGTGNVFTGLQYGTFQPDEIGYCYKPIAITARNNGWSNATTWLGAGRVGYYSDGPSAVGGYAVYIDQEATSGEVIDQHQFYGVSFENAMSANKPSGAIRMNCWQCIWDGCRFEGFDDPKFNTNFVNSAYNQVRSGSHVGNPSSAILPAATPRPTWFQGADASLLAGGNGTDPILAIQECNSSANIGLVIRDTAKTDRFRVKSSGELSIQSSSAWGQDFGAVFSGQDTWDPPSLANGQSSSKIVTLTAKGGGQGAAVPGDWAVATLSTWQQGFQLTAVITSSNTAVVTLTNNSGGTVDLGSGTIKVLSFKASVG